MQLVDVLVRKVGIAHVPRGNSSALLVEGEEDVGGVTSSELQYTCQFDLVR